MVRHGVEQGAALSHIANAGAALIAALALVAAVERLPVSVQAAHSRVDENAALSPLERELAPTRAFGLDPRLVLRADELLPRDAVFAVVTGPGIVSGHAAAAPWASYWLLPRRHTQDVRRADWILAYGADPAELGVDVELVEDLGSGMRIFRRPR